MKLPLRHLSVRVPWHDKGWNGTICDDPRNNASCMFLPRIQSKDVEYEESKHSQELHEISADKLPPCVGEKVTFMSSHELSKKVNHPYADFEEKYAHYKETVLRYPAHSFAVIPYRWMIKDKDSGDNWAAKEYGIPYDYESEPKLSFEDQWVQQHENQREILDTFSSSFKPDESLVFVYAKNIPLIESVSRVLIGVGRVTKVGELTEYSYSTKNPPLRGYLWERPVFHSIRPAGKDGFLLPYQEIIEKLREIADVTVDDYIAYAPQFDEFSYGSELVSHDSAIDALLALRHALLNCGRLLGNSYDAQIEWINDRLSEIWDMRGAYPGLGAVLSAMQLPEGNLIAREIEKHLHQKDEGKLLTDPWQLVNELFNGSSEWLLQDIRKKIGKTFSGIWQKLSPDRKQFLRLLSRMAINNDEAAQFINITDSLKFVENPYLFFEKSRLNIHPISLSIVDKAIFPPQSIQDAFPLEEPSLVTEAIDTRRVRAIAIEQLEIASGQGHSLLTQEQIITLCSERSLEPPCKVTRDILSFVEQSFATSDGTGVTIIPASTDEPCFYKLERLAAIRDKIRSFVLERTTKGKRLPVNVDWHGIVAAKFGLIDQHLSIEAIRKEERAREEKAAALDELARSRFSVLIGPAGTGKTTLLNLLCEQPDIQTPGILRLAPTGKARVKMGPDAQTIAQFLVTHDRYDPATCKYFMNERGKRYSDARTVIIDEASMLTEEQLAAILDTVVNVERFILVGDPRQLPPIGTGKPFVDIVALLKPVFVSPGKPIRDKAYAELQVICRQGMTDESGHDRIDVRLSKWFSPSPIRKEGDIFAEIESQPGKNWGNLKLVSWYGVNELQDAIVRELTQELKLQDEHDQLRFGLSLGGSEYSGSAYFNTKSAEKAEAWQILSPVNANGYGTKELNRFIQKRFKAKTIELAQNPPPYKYRTWPDSLPIKRISPPVGEDNMVYGDKVINLSNTRWNKKWQTIYPDIPSALRYFANGEIGIITGEFRGKKMLDTHFSVPKERRRKLGNPRIQIAFSSQPGYCYQFTAGHFKEDGEIQFELAYAITTHKSQGSGFNTVFLVLPNPCFILSRELLYTALTRQEERIIIFHQGDFKDFRKYITDEFSETGRRLTDLFSVPTITEVNKKFYDKKYVQISAMGEFMISKSEVIIADHLFYNDIRYTYEKPITDARGITIHPDFTVENDNTGVIYYWEHLGMLTDDKYRSKWELKQEWYNLNGVVPYQDASDEDDKILITSKDKPDKGIDSEEILRLIRQVIKGEK
jgi:ATP-dependent exoDNAse (exonuclease V) alpha subunit